MEVCAVNDVEISGTQDGFAEDASV